MPRHLPLFIVCFLVTLAIQTLWWQHATLMDNNHWEKRIVALHERSHDIFTYPDFANPNLAVISLGTLLHKTDLSTTASLYAATSLLVSLSVAGICLITRLLASQQPWWLLAGIIASTNPLYLATTPQDAVIAPALALHLLLIAYTLQRKHATRWLLFGLSLTAGVSLATRLPLSLFILSTTTILLLLQQQKRVALHAILGGLYCFVLLDPILFTRPVDHLRAVFAQAILHTNQLVRGTITLFDIAAFAPFACLSFSLGIAIFFLYKRLSLPFSQLFLAYTLLLTLGLLGIFTHTSVQTMRYLYVPIFWWDVMLPIQLLSLTHATRLSPLLARYLVTISIIGSFSVYLFIRWFYYLLPEVLLQLLRVPVP